MLRVFHQHESPGEETVPHVPEHAVLNKDLLLDKIKAMRDLINNKFDKNGRVEAIVKALRKVEEETLNDAPRRGILRKNKPKQREEITTGNILKLKRRRKNGTSESGGEREDEPESNDKNTPGQNIVKKNRSGIKINDTVKIKTSKFGIGYSKGRPEYTFGKVLTLM
jgi:hypothetical protein